MADTLTLPNITVTGAPRNGNTPESSSFSERNLKAVITLPNSVFINDSNVVVIQNAKMSASIIMAGSASLPIGNFVIYGLSKDIMDKLTVYQWNFAQYTNAVIELYANDNLVYSGTFLESYADYSNMPNVPFIIRAVYGITANLQNVNALSFGKAVKVTDIATSICNLMDEKITVINGLKKHDDKGNAIPIPTLTDATFWGSPLTMLWKLRTDANINISIWNGEAVLTYIGDYNPNYVDIPLVNSETGLVGSPVRKTQTIWALKVLYHPAFKPEGLIRIQSKLVPNAGNFYATIYNMTFSLDSQTPNGQWFIDMEVWMADYAK